MHSSSIALLDKELRNLLQIADSLVILFMGNELRGDDQVGVYIGQQLASVQFNQKVKTLVVFTVPTNFLSKIVEKHPTHILVVDAVKIEEKGGTVVYFHQEAVLDTKSTSTHYQEFKNILQFLQEELQHEVRLSVLGIQVETTEFNTSLSVNVKKNADQIIKIFQQVFS